MCDETYRFLDHTADASVEVTADSREGLIRASIAALAELMDLGDPPDDRSLAEGFSLRGDGKTPAEQLVNLLNEWLVVASTKQVYPVITYTAWDKKEARVLVEVHEIDGIRPPQKEVKAITYHAAAVIAPEKGEKLWRATWIADL